jgi:hypothetical protein
MIFIHRCMYLRQGRDTNRKLKLKRMIPLILVQIPQPARYNSYTLLGHSCCTIVSSSPYGPSSNIYTSHTHRSSPPISHIDSQHVPNNPKASSTQQLLSPARHSHSSGTSRLAHHRWRRYTGPVDSHARSSKDLYGA